MTETIDLTLPNITSIQSQSALLRLQDLLATLDLKLRNAGVDSAILDDIECAQVLAQTAFRAPLRTISEETPEAVAGHMRTSETGYGRERSTARRYEKGPTPMAVHALGSLRVAANACTQWDRERGITCGLGKVLTEYATATREEVFGAGDR